MSDEVNALINDKLDRLEKNVEGHNETFNRIFSRVESLEKENMIVNVQYGYIADTLKEIKVDLVALKEKPAKRWDLVVTTIITVIVAAVAGFVVSKLS